jgi:acyl-CoA dehydrogenase
MKSRVAAARLLCWKAAWLHDEGCDNAREASVAKVFASGIAINICIRALELAGRADLPYFSALEKLYRDAQAFEFLEGTGDIQKLSIAKTLTHLII